MIKCEIVREKLFLRGRASIHRVKVKNGCRVTDDGCFLRLGREWFVKQRALVIHSLKL